MPGDHEQLARPKLLLGEGEDEKRFFTALAEHLSLADVQVEQYGGKLRLRAFLRTLPARPGYADLVSIGITRDADESADDAFRSVCRALRDVPLPEPPSPGQAV